MIPGSVLFKPFGHGNQSLWAATYGDVIVGDHIYRSPGGWCVVTDVRIARGGTLQLTARHHDERVLRFTEHPATAVQAGGMLTRPLDTPTALMSIADAANDKGHLVDAEQGQAVLVCPRCRQPVTVDLVVDLVVDLAAELADSRADVGQRLAWALVAHLQSYCRASARYAWVCDTDHTTPHGQPGTRAGTTGPRWAAGPLLRRLEAGQGTRWRTLYDEADMPVAERLVHSGRLLMADDAPGNAEFGPLDDLSQPDCGAAEIQYLDGGAWKTL
jgi:hypothetical protein